MLILVAQYQKEIAQKPYTLLSFFFNKFVFHELFLRTKKGLLSILRSNVCQKLENIAPRNRRWHRKEVIFFFKKICFYWRHCYGHVTAVLKIMPKMSAPKVRIVFAQCPKTLSKNFVWIKILWAKMFLWTHKKQNWRNCKKFPPRIRNDLHWSPKLVKAW